MRPIFLCSFLLLTSLGQAQQCLIADYHLNGNPADSSGNSYHGVVMGATLTADRNGNPDGAYLFDGTDDFIELNQNQFIIPTPNFTITSWARMDGVGGGSTSTNPIFTQRADPVNNTSAIALYSESSTGNSRVVVRTNGQSNEITEDLGPGYGTWNHYAGVCSNDSIKLYINGIHVSSTAFTQSAGSVIQNIVYVYIGRHSYAGGMQASFNGAIDNVKIFDCALKSSDIQDIYSTSTLEVDKSHAIIVFPNPSNSIVQLSGFDPALHKLEVIDMLGQDVSIDLDRSQFSTTDLSTGVYQLLISNQEGVLQQTTSLVVQ